MAGQTADAVVIGAGPNGLVAANALVDAGWDVVRARGAGRGRRRRAQRRGRGTGVRHRPVQRLLPAGGGQPGDPRPRTSERHGLLWTQAPARPGPRARRRPARRAAPRRRAHRAGLDEFAPVTAKPGWGWSRVATDPRPVAGRAVHPVPAGALRLSAAAPAGDGRHALDLARLAAAAGAAARPGGVRRRGGAAAADRQRDAQRRAPGRRGQRRVRLAAGDARPGRRLPGAARAAPGSSPPRCAAGRGRRRCRCAPAPRSTRCRGPGGRAVGVRLADGRRCGPPGGARRRAAHRRSTATWSARSTCRPGCSTTCAGSSGTTRRSRSTGPWTGRCPWRRRGAPRAGTVHLGVD